MKQSLIGSDLNNIQKLIKKFNKSENSYLDICKTFYNLGLKKDFNFEEAFKRNKRKDYFAHRGYDEDTIQLYKACFNLGKSKQDRLDITLSPTLPKEKVKRIKTDLEIFWNEARNEDRLNYQKYTKERGIDWKIWK